MSSSGGSYDRGVAEGFSAATVIAQLILADRRAAVCRGHGRDINKVVPVRRIIVHGRSFACPQPDSLKIFIGRVLSRGVTKLASLACAGMIAARRSAIHKPNATLL